MTDSIEIIILELPKVQKYSNNTKLNTWLKFINTGDLDMNNADNSMKQAKKVLDEISSDEKERYLAELRLKYILDQNNAEETGFERGLQQGVERGSKNTKIEIAKQLKKSNVNIEIIIQSTGLTKEEIENL